MWVGATVGVAAVRAISHMMHDERCVRYDAQTGFDMVSAYYSVKLQFPV